MKSPNTAYSNMKPLPKRRSKKSAVVVTQPRRRIGDSNQYSGSVKIPTPLVPGTRQTSATFAPAAEFGVLMAAEARRRGAGHVPPAHHPRRRRALDLEPRHREIPRSHPDRGPVPHHESTCTTSASCSPSVVGDQHATWCGRTAATRLRRGASRRCCRRPRLPAHRGQSRGAGYRPGLLRDQRPPDALQALPLPPPVRRLRRREGRLSGHRAAPQTLRHALVLRRGRRHPHPALPASQRPLGRNWQQLPTGQGQPDRHLTTTRTQTIQARPGYRSVTYILVPHPPAPQTHALGSPVWR